MIAIFLTILSFCIAGVAAASARCHWIMYTQSRQKPVVLATDEQLGLLPEPCWDDAGGRWPSPAGMSLLRSRAFAVMAEGYARRERRKGRLIQVALGIFWALFGATALSGLTGAIRWFVGLSVPSSKTAGIGFAVAVVALVTSFREYSREEFAEAHERRAVAYRQAAEAQNPEKDCQCCGRRCFEQEPSASVKNFWQRFRALMQVN